MLSVLMALTLALSGMDGVATRSTAELYAARPEAARAIVNEALNNPALNDDGRLKLLTQRLRIEQSSRLLGRPVANEAETVSQVTQLSKSTKDEALIGEARFRLAVSAFYSAVLSGQAATVEKLVPQFSSAAALIANPCVRAEALFFAGLMPQIAGHMAASRSGLEIADRAARAGKCFPEQSFTERHLAVVAAEERDLVRALELADHSLFLRRRAGMRIHLPLSLLLVADIQLQLGNRSGADRSALEAAEIARSANIPAGLAAACTALANRPRRPGYCR